MRREEREKGPAPTDKCPVVGNVAPGPGYPLEEVDHPAPEPNAPPPSTYMAPIINPNGVHRAPIVSYNGATRAPVVSPTNNGSAWTPLPSSNGSTRAPVVSPTNGRGNGQNNGSSRAPVVAPTNNGSSRAPVVSPTNGQYQINNGSWQTVQQGGQNNGRWAQQGPVSPPEPEPIWRPDPEARTSIGRVSQDSTNLINLNEEGDSYLMLDPEGHIQLVRDDVGYQLIGDAEGRIPLEVDGECGVWVQANRTAGSTAGPSVAQMFRGQEGSQIINGMQSQGPQTNWFQQRLAPTMNGDEWYASQW